MNLRELLPMEEHPNIEENVQGVHPMVEAIEIEPGKRRKSDLLTRINYILSLNPSMKTVLSKRLRDRRGLEYEGAMKSVFDESDLP